MDRAWSRRAAITCALVVLVTGCGSAATASPSSTATAQPSSTATATPSPSPVPATPSPTAVPTAAPTGYEPQPDGTIYWYTDSGDREAVPTIDGLTAEVQGGKPLYKAKAANSFGLKTGAYAGAFNRYVRVEGKQTGGVVLEPQVVNKLIQDKLATISDRADKWVAAVPVDFRMATVDTDFSITFISGYGSYNIGVASISFTGDLPIVNTIPGSTQSRVAANSYYGWTTYDPQREEDSLYTNPINDLMVAGEFEGFSANTTKNASFGGQVCQTTGPVNISVQTGLGSKDVTSKDILYLPNLDDSTSNTPVGVAK